MIGEELKRRKEAAGLTTLEWSKLSGVPVGTINKILSGETRAPRMDTMQSLELILKKLERDNTLCDNLAENVEYMLNDEKKQGTYTAEDYDALPDNVRAELIDGSLIVMEAPSSKHQIVLGELFIAFRLFIRENKGKCKAFMSPLDVRLDEDNHTIVQPDLMVVCNPDKVEDRYISGAPDLIVEILSPRTKLRDYRIKLVKYAEAGVREYWIVDPIKEKVVIYFWEEDEFPHVYGFDDMIPVAIYDGKMQIDFSEIKKELL